MSSTAKRGRARPPGHAGPAAGALHGARVEVPMSPHPMGSQPHPMGSQPPYPGGGQPPYPMGGQPPHPMGGQPPHPMGGQPPHPMSGQALRAQVQVRKDPTSQVGDFRTPLYKLLNQEASILLLIELPGVDPQEIDLQVRASDLVLNAKCSPAAIEEQFYQYYGTLELPEQIEPDKAKAEYKHGLLRVTLPKVEAAASKQRKVKVEVSEAKTAR
jgi:HSP20 family molecular chaperone IbpA